MPEFRPPGASGEFIHCAIPRSDYADEVARSPGRSALPSLPALISTVVEENVEVPGWAAERSEQQRNLPSMMHSMNGRVVH